MQESSAIALGSNAVVHVCGTPASGTLAPTCSLELQDNLGGLRQALGVDLGADAGHDQRCLVAIAQPHHLAPC